MVTFLEISTDNLDLKEAMESAESKAFYNAAHAGKTVEHIEFKGIKMVSQNLFRYLFTFEVKYEK